MVDEKLVHFYVKGKIINQALLLKNEVNVVSENEKYVLREIQAGDCFGEVSVLFNIKCTADVKTVNRYREVFRCLI